MIKHIKIIILLLLTVTISFSSCKKAEKSMPLEEAAKEESMSPSADMNKLSDDFDGRGEGSKKRKSKEAQKKGLQSHFILPFEHGKERLLEYKVSLTYETKSLRLSRQKLLGLVNKYGFIINSTSNVQNRHPYVNSTVQLKAVNLYAALKDFDDIGILTNENITVIDHTEQMVLSERKMKREQLRIARRNRASGKITASSKNWDAIERSIERSENQLDENAHEKWKIEDRVTWAKVQLYVKGPEKPVEIDVPNYLDAFKSMINAILEFIYGLIVALPFLIIIAAIVLAFVKRKAIKDFILRKKE